MKMKQYVCLSLILLCITKHFGIYAYTPGKRQCQPKCADRNGGKKYYGKMPRHFFYRCCSGGGGGDGAVVVRFGWLRKIVKSEFKITMVE